MSLSWPATISHRIDEVIRSYTSATAIKDGYGNVLSYVQLADRMNSIAKKLLDVGAGEGTPVAVFQEPSADWMSSMLAIFRIGAIYIPLDLKNGPKRIRGSINVSRPELVLVDQWTLAQSRELQLPQEQLINVSNIETVEDCAEIHNLAKANSTAVVLFTSGSTGVPKGIMLPHSCFATHAEGTEKAWQVGPQVVLQQITLSFDFSLHQIFTALANGGTLCVVPSHMRGDPAQITRLMLREHVSYTLATPTEYSLWFQEGGIDLAKCESWKWALTGGEALPKSIIRRFANLTPSSPNLYDFYGPVEATIAMTKGEILYNEVDLEPALPTGHMLPNYSVYILDEQQRPVPIGVPGEIVAGGPGIAAGYLGLDELTAEKFIENPFADVRQKSSGWDRLCRTGDQGYFDEAGALYYQGRINGDTQVKLHGIRVELGEIESAIIEAAGDKLSQAAVTLHHADDMSQFLVAYVVCSASDSNVSRDDLLSHLRSSLNLPSYMQPSQFIVVDSIPMNPHGKTDRKQLKQIPLEPMGDLRIDASSAQLSDSEVHLGEQWRKVLPSRGVNLQPETDFFHAGGNSLLLVKLQRILKEELGHVPRLADLMNSSTLKSMSATIDKVTRSPTVDWESDMALPTTWGTALRPLLPKFKDNPTILLTGATGYLGRHLLQTLVEKSEINKVICLVRNPAKLVLAEHDKVQTILCDLDMPNMGLSGQHFEELATTTDVIIHCAANRSFWDSYESLRGVNVLPVQELIRMASPRQIPVHFLSSGAASPSSTDGYLLSKFVAEELLKSASGSLGLQVYIHTPEGLAQGTDPTNNEEVINAFVTCAQRVGARPGFDGFRGHMDLLETDVFVEKLNKAIVKGMTVDVVGSVGSTASRVAYQGVHRVDVKKSIIDHLGEHAEWQSLPTMDPLLWMGEVKRAGFPYVITAQDITVSSNSGQLITRR